LNRVETLYFKIFLKQGRYIKEFNKKKGWWRTKWKVITVLSPFISMVFCLYAAFYIDV